MTKLNALKGDDWNGLDQIIIFGFGRQGRKMYPTLKRDFNIVGIVDNSKEKHGMLVDEYKIMAFEEAKPILKKYKIIVTTSQYYYQFIREQLEEIRLEENKDFVMYQQFVTEWYYKNKGKINVIKTNISLTPLCTLKCEKCMMFIPYWDKDKRVEYDVQMKKNDLDVYFQSVDYLLDLDIVGGEPFLYKYVDEILTYIGTKFRNRIGYVGFITNGTILPNQETLDIMREYRIDVSISDYSSPECKNRIPELIGLLDKNEINYIWNKNIDWFDFGFPQNKYFFEGEKAVDHFRRCNTNDHMLDDKKLYYCGIEWSAVKGGLYPLEENAYVDLQKTGSGELEKKEILEMILGNIKGEYLRFCMTCGGYDNNNIVPTAKQLKD